MTSELALYNAHKRGTLDRLTLTYQLRIRSILKKQTEDIFNQAIKIFEGNSSGIDFTKIRTVLDPYLLKQYEDHAEHVVIVGYSDAIQEVTPDQKLNMWSLFPIDQPIEETLDIQLSSKRQYFIDRYFENRKEEINKKLKANVINTRDQYLKSIKEAFAKASQDWFNGEATQEDVKEHFKSVLRKTDAHAETILRTETTSYFNQTRNSYFRNETIVDYIQLFAITDGRISRICETRHGFVVPIDKAHLPKYMPPFHYNCRTVQKPLISVIPRHKEIIKKGKLIPESRFAPLLPGWNK